VVRIVYKHKVAPGDERAFTDAWHRCRTKLIRRGVGALEAVLFRDATDPTAFFTVTCWRSLEDWQAYWATGVADPEGHAANNQILVEVMSVPPTRPLPSAG